MHLSHIFDQLLVVAPRFGLGPEHAYRRLVLIGALNGFLFVQVLAALIGLHPAIAWWAATAGAVGCYSLGLLARLVTQREVLVFYRHFAASLAAAYLAVTLTGQPVLPYLELVALGAGLAQAIGRLGCFFAGCCHGLVAHWGVRYGDAHRRLGCGAADGARRLPVQLVESLWILAVVAATAALVVAGSTPGFALVVFLTLHASGRFSLEFWRGDKERLRWHGFSEAQWTALVILGLSGLVLMRFGSAWPASFCAGLAVLNRRGRTVAAWQNRPGRGVRLGRTPLAPSTLELVETPKRLRLPE